MTASDLITVATYNICHGVHAAFDWQYLTSSIRAVQADVVGLQEVDMHTRRSHGCDSLSALAAASGLSHALFVPTMDYDGGRYGTAILSRYPMDASEIIPLPTQPGLEPRAAGAVRITLPGTSASPGGRPLWFVNTHLAYRSAEARQDQLTALADRLGTLLPPDTPTVVTADFNTEEPLHPLEGACFASINRDRRYLSFRERPIAIDDILHTPHLTPVAHGMIESDASDHNLLWCRFTY